MCAHGIPLSDDLGCETLTARAKTATSHSSTTTDAEKHDAPARNPTVLGRAAGKANRVQCIRKMPVDEHCVFGACVRDECERPSSQRS